MKTTTTAISMLAAFALTGCGESPTNTVESFYKSIEKGDLQHAREHLSQNVIDTFGLKKVNAAMDSMNTKITNCGGIKSITQELKGEGDTKIGTIQVAYKGGCQPTPEKVKLIKEDDGVWRITLAK